MSVATGIALALDRGDWRAESACKDTDPDLFFPVGTTGPAIEQIEAAKAVCGICPVQSQCLEFALATTASGSGTTIVSQAVETRSSI